MGTLENSDIPNIAVPCYRRYIHIYIAFVVVYGNMWKLVLQYFDLYIIVLDCWQLVGRLTI